MKCPHCTVDFHVDESQARIGADPDGAWAIGVCTCSACKRFVIRLINGASWSHPTTRIAGEFRSFLVWPKAAARVPVSPEVPASYSDDYKEACLVLADSPKASAALSRRCLQLLLRDEGKTISSDLADQIEEVIEAKTLPSHILDGLDAVRITGNFAAHATKSKSTGEVLPVELGKAEWNRNVLEDLFDYYFVAPARTKAKREALNKKLADAGKPPLK